MLIGVSKLHIGVHVLAQQGVPCLSLYASRDRPQHHTGHPDNDKRKRIDVWKSKIWVIISKFRLNNF